MGAVFGRAMDGESENGRSTRSVKLAPIGEAPFLLVTFLWALAKKSDPPTAEALKKPPQPTPSRTISLRQEANHPIRPPPIRRLDPVARRPPPLPEYRQQLAEGFEPGAPVDRAAPAGADAAERKRVHAEVQQRVVDTDATRQRLRNDALYRRRIMAEGIQRQRAVVRVDPGDRLIERAIRSYGQDRPEDFLAHQRAVVGCIQHQRRREKALLRVVEGNRLDDPRTTGARLVDIAGQAAVLAVIDDPRVVIRHRRVAVAGAQFGAERIDEGISARRVDQGVVDADAGLPGVEPFTRR